MPDMSIEDIDDAWLYNAWILVCRFGSWSYKWLCSAAHSIGRFLAPLWDKLGDFASFLYHFSKNFIEDRLVIIWDTLSSPEFHDNLIASISYFLAYLLNTYHIYQIIIINFFRIIKSTVGVIFSIWNMNNLAQNNRQDERKVGMVNEVVSLGSQVVIIIATLLTIFACCMNPLVLASLATGTSVIYLIQESYFTHKNRMAVKEEEARLDKINDVAFKTKIKAIIDETLSPKYEKQFRSKRGVVFAVINLIGAGLMLTGCIWFPPLATVSTYIFAVNTFCEVIDRRLFDYKHSRRIADSIDSLIHFFIPKKTPIAPSVNLQESKRVIRESVTDEKVLPQERKETLQVRLRKRSNSVGFFAIKQQPDLSLSPSSSNPSGKCRAR